MTYQARYTLIIFISGLFLLLDRVFKYLSLHQWTEIHLLNRYLGWQPSLNKGIAFSLPMPGPVIIALTIPVILTVSYLLYKNIHNLRMSAAFMLIILGALSNLFDRLFYHYTVDYFLIFTIIINIADIMITIGFVLYLIGIKKHRTRGVW